MSSPGPGVAISGVGAVGARAARQLAATPDTGTVVLHGPGGRPSALRNALAGDAVVADPTAADVGAVVLAGPAGTQLEPAEEALRGGRHVVATSDDVDEVRALLDLDDLARAHETTLVVGAGFAPGLSCVLTRHVAGWMDVVEEVHVARFGTGGPACARQHHHALRSRAVDWRDGEWLARRGGSGRELVVFPEPIGSLDCYRAALPDALLLHPAFPDAERITARQAANRRQRLFAFLPMLRRPHPEGRIGAVSVELRGRNAGTCVTEVVGCIERPAVAAGAVAGLAARWALAGRFAPGAAGLGVLVDTPTEFLHALGDYGIRAAVFEGVS